MTTTVRADPTYRRHQQALLEQGYALDRHGADGVPGPETEGAISRFQEDHDLPQTGRFDESTLELLEPQAAPVELDGSVRPRARPENLVVPTAPEVSLRPEPRPDTLTAPSLTSDETLARVASGDVVLGKGAEGAPVRRVQEALMGAGFELPRFGADGDFGSETETAVRAVQRESGLEETGHVDAPTLGAIERLAASSVRYPEYDRLFEDGRLETTIAIGYDEGNHHVEQRRQILEQLDQRGFEPVDVRGMSDDELKAAGIDPSRVDRDASYFVKPFEAGGRDVQAVVRLIDPSHPHAREAFGEAFANDELMLYAGHARHGSGPDFDDIASPAGNFVIGPTYDTGHVTYGENDLSRTEMTDRYQLMLFSACTSQNYVDELRSIAPGKDASNLDVFASTDLVYWGGAMTNNVFAVLDGVMEQQSVGEVQSRLAEINGEPFVADGFRGNTSSPHPS